MNTPALLLLILTTLIPFYGEARIAIYGDTRTHPEIHTRVATAIATHKPDNIFHTGDLNNKGQDQAEYDEFKSIISAWGSTPAFWPARGNHERDLGLFKANFPYLPDSYYSVTADSIRFIILDSNLPMQPGTEQYAWFEHELSNSASMPCILILHHPVFSSGYHGDSLKLSLWLPALLQKHRVLAVFSGHEHAYERSVVSDIQYVITGGGGAPLRDKERQNPHSIIYVKTHHYIIADRTGDMLQLTVYTLDGSILEAFSINLR